MTPTKIITAQGTYRLEGEGKRWLRRGLIAGGTFMGLLLASAAAIGFAKAATAPHTPAPKPAISKSIPNYDSALRDIRRLAARPATTKTNSDGSKISDPNGMAILQECLSDSTLSIAELRACITQPAN